MPWREPDSWGPVGCTCPAIGKMKFLVRKHVTNEDARREMPALMEELRVLHAQLRFNERYWRERAIW